MHLRRTTFDPVATRDEASRVILDIVNVASRGRGFHAIELKQHANSLKDHTLAVILARLGLHTKDNVLFALATGMRTVAFRLPPSAFKSALDAGGVLAIDLGPEWIQWQLGWNMDLRPWTKLALDYAS